MAKEKETEAVAEEPSTEIEQPVSETEELETNEAALEESDAETDSDTVAGADAEAVADAVEADDEEEAPLTLEEQLVLAQQEAGQNMENWQRAVAELANYKRRQEEQRKLLRDRIKSEVLEGVISALDDMDLAFQNVPEELDGQLVGWVEGFRLVNRKLDKILDDQNVMPIPTEGEFDPNLHEAVSYEDSEEHGENQIIAELRKGYQIGNRVIRPALVRVAK